MPEITTSTMNECEVDCDPILEVLERLIGHKLDSTVWIGHVARGAKIRVTWWPKRG